MADLILDVFNSDPFRNVALTNRVNSTVPFVPGFLTQLGLFTSEGVLTTDVAFEEMGGSLRLISTSPRGAPPSQAAQQKGRVRKLTAVHLAREATINADELLGARAYGTMSQQTAELLIDRRVEGPTGLKTEMAYTWEHMYLGCIDGTVLDGDGVTVLYDYFNFYGIARPAPIVIPFSTSTNDGAQIKNTMAKVTRQMTQALNGMPIGSGKKVALCGDNFFDRLTGSKEVIAAQKIGATGNISAADAIGMDIAYGNLQYASTTWVNYRGSADGLVSVPTDEARMFMSDVPGLFQQYFAPADTFETVSLLGLPFFLLQRPEAQTSSRRVFELQSNPLVACLRPQSLVRLVSG